MPVTSKDSKGESNSPEMPNVISFEKRNLYLDCNSFDFITNVDLEELLPEDDFSEEDCIAMLFGLCDHGAQWQLYSQVEAEGKVFYDKGNRTVNRTGVYAAFKRKAFPLKVLKAKKYSFGDRGVTYVSSEGKKLKIK